MAVTPKQDKYDPNVYDEYLLKFLALPPTSPLLGTCNFHHEDDFPEIVDKIEPLDDKLRNRPKTADEIEKEDRQRSEENRFRKLLCYDYPDPKEDPPDYFRMPIYWVNSRIDSRFIDQIKFPRRRYALITKGYLPPIEVPEPSFYNTLPGLLREGGFLYILKRLQFYGFSEVSHLYDWDIEVCDYLIEDLIDNDNDDDYWWDKWISVFSESLKSYKRVIVA